VTPIAPLVALAATALWVRERRARRTAERFGAALLEALLNAIDANDEDTGRHVRRVAAYALAIAQHAGLDDAACREVEHVALFHDVGKIHAALFDIVHDESGLSARDRAAIATHPARGAEVLAPLEPFYPYLAEGVLSHHECWNGKGYPRGLAGQEIPRSARIVAIADTFDAITHARRYSRGQSREAALDVIRRGRGAQFDPELVDLFLAPDVQAEVQAAGQRLAQPRARHERRRRPRREPFAPDVAFRWRERRSAGFEPDAVEAAARTPVRQPRADGSGRPRVTPRGQAAVAAEPGRPTVPPA
jgi:HD-GYP domain-containing protein (c-di-GMP phosphodiesterase class II)